MSTLFSLAAAAAPAATAAGRAPLAVLDARRGEAFAGAWTTPDPDAGVLIEPAALSPEALTGAIRERPERWLAVGDGAIRFRHALEDSGAQVPDDGAAVHRVSALQHCRLASGMRPQTPDDVLPDYLRVPDAELSLRARTAATATS